MWMGVGSRCRRENESVIERNGVSRDNEIVLSTATSAIVVLGGGIEGCKV